MSQLVRFLCRMLLPLGVLLALAFSAGCTQRVSYWDHKNNAALKQEALIIQLREAGIQISAVGDEVTVWLRTADFFPLHSTHFFADKASILDTTIKFINLYNVSDIQVSPYIDSKEAAIKERRALAQTQAQYVSSYLWSHGVRAQLIAVKEHTPSASCKNIDDMIQIGFRKKVLDYSFH